MTSILDPNLAAVVGPAPAGSGLPQPPVFGSVDAERNTARNSSPPDSGSSASSASPRASRATSRCATRNTPSISGSIHSGWRSPKSKRPTLSWSITKAM